MSCGNNLFLSLEYKIPHESSHEACGFGRHYHFIMYSMIGKGE